jgi:hypothetical protein
LRQSAMIAPALTPREGPARPTSDDVWTIRLLDVRFYVNVGCSDGWVPSDQGALWATARSNPTPPSS